jgi:hypothetical protein
MVFMIASLSICHRWTSFETRLMLHGCHVPLLENACGSRAARIDRRYLTNSTSLSRHSFVKKDSSGL